MRFYFTFGTDEHYPYRGGWAEVEADDLREACSIFRYHFPNRLPGILHCADYYTEEQFKASGMMETGNLGAFCHCRLSESSFEAIGPGRKGAAAV